MHKILFDLNTFWQISQIKVLVISSEFLFELGMLVDNFKSVSQLTICFEMKEIGAEGKNEMIFCGKYN